MPIDDFIFKNVLHMLSVKYVPQKCNLFKTSAFVMVHCTLCEGVCQLI